MNDYLPTRIREHVDGMLRIAQKRGLSTSDCVCELCELAESLLSTIRKARADELKRFADANRFSSGWVVFRRSDMSPVTVNDLLRERAQEILEES